MTIESIVIGADLAKALAAAQRSRCRHLESAAILPLARECKIRWATRATDLTQAFFARIIFGATDCWYWIGQRGEGDYGRFKGARRFGCPELMAHRIAWHLWNGPVPDGLKVLHQCDVPPCVNPEHLFVGTQADNVADMHRKGRARVGPPKFGMSNPRSRLTDAIVVAIRTAYARGDTTQKALAIRYEVGVMTVNRAIRGISWKHL